MKSNVVLLVSVVLSSAVFGGDPPADSVEACRTRYEALRTQYDQNRDDAIAAAVGAGTRELTTLLVNVRQQGDLDYVVEIEKELKRLDEEKVSPSHPAPKAMKHLRRVQWAMRQAEDKARQEHVALRRKLDADYLALLDQLEKRLVAANRIDEAKLARHERERIETDRKERVVVCVDEHWGLAGAPRSTRFNTYTFQVAATGSKAVLHILAAPSWYQASKGTATLVTPAGLRVVIWEWKTEDFRQVVKENENVSAPRDSFDIDVTKVVTAPGRYELRFDWQSGRAGLSTGRCELILTLPPEGAPQAAADFADDKETEAAGPILALDFTDDFAGQVNGAVKRPGGVAFDGLPDGNEIDQAPDSEHDYVHFGPDLAGFSLQDFTILVDCRPENTGALIGSGAAEPWPREWQLTPGTFHWVSTAGRTGSKVRVENSLNFECPTKRRVKIALTRSGSLVTVYVNGRKTASSDKFPKTALSIYSHGLWIGNTKIGQGKYTRWLKYLGEIRRVEVHGTVLDERRIGDW